MNSIKLFLLIFLAVFVKNSFSQSNDSTSIRQLKKMFTEEQMKHITYKENHFVFTDSVGVEHLIDLISEDDLEKIRLDIIKKDDIRKEESIEINKANIEPNQDIRVIDESK